MEENNYRYFALTINKNYRKNAKMQNSDYADIILSINQWIVNYTFETGGIQNRLHCHMLLKFSEEHYDILRFKLSNCKSYYWYMEECTDHQGWLNYINKEKSFFSS